MKKPRIYYLIGICVAVIALAIILFLVLRPKEDPAKKFAALLAKQGIEKPNIVLITLDTTRADRLACYGYSGVKTPHLDSLARQGILFEQCTASSPLTLPSHASIMTGLYPTFHGVRVNGNTALSETHLTLAELFSQQGYQCGAFIGAFVLDGRWGLKQGFHHYDDQFDLKKYKQLDLGLVQRPGNEVVDAALSWLETQKENPFLAWVHLYDPHTPYEPPEPYFSEYNTSIAGLYDGEIAFTDEQVGRCVDWLVENGLDRNTIIFIMGDHGEGLGEHGESTHGYYIYDYAVQVPFVIVTPFDDFQGIRQTSQVRTIDLYPTLLEMAGIPVPEENQGESLLAMIFDPVQSKDYYAYGESLSPNILFGWSALHCLRNSQYKYIDAPRPELYDLVQDPQEFNNLRNRFPKIARELKEALYRIIEQSSLEAPKPEAANLDNETVQRLAALGYIGAPVARKPSSGKGEELADPKDKLRIYVSVQQAGELINKEEYDQGVRILESVLREEPLIPQARLLLATSYFELDRKEEAKEQYDFILKNDPKSVQALIGLANVLLEEGKKEDVIALCKQTVSIDEQNTQAYTIMGEIYMGENDHSQALPYLEKAVEIQPKLAQTRLNLAACLVSLKSYDRAEVFLEGVLEEYPKFPLAHYHLALLHEEQGDLETARGFYLKEVAYYPDHYKARFNLGKILFKLGDRKGYMEQMQEVIRIAPEAAEGYLFFARGLLYESPDIDRALELVEKGLPLAKSSDMKALGYFLLADIYTRKNQPQKVEEALRKANSYRSK
ncbi:MAG: sulfatase-like hydrolase/transferase [Candidatus Aminicenantes bacterium]|nr:sulfatase-like hydrolase/transferase [Candidatus Aminicenantes bacterium]